jgi:carbon monoxide dehydrogenase subunit G
MPAPVFTYRRGYPFRLPPERLWQQLEEVDQFERWSPWLSDLAVEGDGLSLGSVLSGVVNPPVPYRMRLRVEVVECDRPHSIGAVISGDLVGEARLGFRPDGGGTWVDVEWTVEMMQPAMRLASRIGRPVLPWGHDRVVEMTVAGFRRRIESL